MLCTAFRWVVYFAETDMYYLCQSQQGGLVVTGTKDLTQFTQEGPVVWTPPSEFKDLWAPGEYPMACVEWELTYSRTPLD